MYLETVQMLVKEVRCLADAGRKNNASDSNKLGVRTVEELLEYAEQFTDTLKSLLGEADFYAGRMPPCVPYWCFQDIGR